MRGGYDRHGFVIQTFGAVVVLINIMAEQGDVVEPVRFIYNVTPSSRILQGKSAIPAAFHYTPQEKLNCALLEYAPLTCSCEAVFNPHCEINFNNKSVRCCFCGAISQLPSNYAQQIAPNKLPYEFMPQNSTLQFRSGAKVANHRYAYLFVVDTNVEEKELAAIREELGRVVQRLPSKYSVGLLAYGRNVHVYEFATKINTNYCLNGSKEYTLVQIMDLLGISVKNDPNSLSSDVNKRFLVPLETHRQAILARIRNIRPDRHIYVNQRKHSCLGQAVSVGISLAEVSVVPTRVVFLVGNPCTVGPGMTISPQFKEQMRSPEQLSKGENIKYFASARQYYDSFIKRTIAKHIILDIFIFTCNEIGFTEMSQLFTSTGGFVVMHEEFSDRIFRESFPKIFPVAKDPPEEQLLCVTEGVVFAYCSREVALNGALGQCHPLSKTKPFVSEKVVGKGGTHAWYLGSIDPLKTITIVYETKESEAKAECYFIQLKTIFKNLNGESVTRVTTVRKEWSNLPQRIIEGFDEEAAAVFLARQCVNKMLYEEQKHIRQWLDQSLVKWAQNYANYIKNDENSFSLPPTMKRLPQLVYHLRRSHFVNRFGISLDESFFKGNCMNRENILNCLAMIQPALLAYSLGNTAEDGSIQPVAVPLNEQEMQDEVILLLDTYFVVLEWYGETVKSWHQNKYHQQEGYQHIANLFESPKMDIEYIMHSRFPVPNYYLVHPYHSKERYLKSRVNPKKTLGQEHENMLTDDSDLKGFTQHLIKVVVKQT